MNRYLLRKLYNSINSRKLRVLLINMIKIARQPYYRIAIDTSNLCNLRCIMCPMSFRDRQPKKPQIIPLPQFQALAQEIFPSTRFLDLSCGGEPFMTKNFIDYLKIARKYCRGSIAIATNGQLLTEDKINLIIKGSLLNEISISCDGLTADTYSSIRINADFDYLRQVLEWIKRAKHNSGQRLLFRLNYTMMRRNIEELVGIYDFAKKYSINVVQLRHMSITADFQHLFKESLYYHQEIADQVISKVVNDFQTDASVQLIAPPLFSSCQDATITKQACAYPWFNFLINSDGSINICQIGIIGNITSGFRNALESEKVKSVRRLLLKGQYHDICKGCRVNTDLHNVKKRSAFIEDHESNHIAPQ